MFIKTQTENTNGRVETNTQKVSLLQILVYRIPFESVITKNLREQRAGHPQNNGLEISINREFFFLERFNGFLRVVHRGVILEINLGKRRIRLSATFNFE